MLKENHVPNDIAFQLSVILPRRFLNDGISFFTIKTSLLVFPRIKIDKKGTLTVPDRLEIKGILFKKEFLKGYDQNAIFIPI